MVYGRRNSTTKISVENESKKSVENESEKFKLTWIEKETRKKSTQDKAKRVNNAQMQVKGNSLPVNSMHTILSCNVRKKLKIFLVLVSKSFEKH